MSIQEILLLLVCAVVGGSIGSCICIVIEHMRNRK